MKQKYQLESSVGKVGGKNVLKARIGINDSI